MYESLDKGKRYLGIFLNMTMAFDSISHDLLFWKLKEIIGHNNTFWYWFKSNIFDRSQTVKINGTIKWFMYS